MHCEFPGRLGVLVQCVSRFSVPFFFMISGYFAWHSSANSQRNALKKFVHIAQITFWSVALYLLIGNWHINARGILYFVLFNSPSVVSGHLWFLFALLYVYCIYGILDRFKLHKAAIAAIPILALGYIVLAQGLHCYGIKVPNCIYRNFLFEGLPWFYAGFFIRSKEKNLTISNAPLVAVLIVSTILAVVERCCFSRDFGICLSTFPQALSLFLLCVKNPTFGRGRLLNRIGQDCSMLVYITHIFIWIIIRKSWFLVGVDHNEVVSYITPLAVVVSTIFLSFLCNETFKTVRSLKMKVDYDRT